MASSNPSRSYEQNYEPIPLPRSVKGIIGFLFVCFAAASIISLGLSYQQSSGPFASGGPFAASGEGNNLVMPCNFNIFAPRELSADEALNPGCPLPHNSMKQPNPILIGPAD